MPNINEGGWDDESSPQVNANMQGRSDPGPGGNLNLPECSSKDKRQSLMSNKPKGGVPVPDGLLRQGKQSPADSIRPDGISGFD